MTPNTYEQRVDAAVAPWRKRMKRLFFPTLVFSIGLFLVGHRIAIVDQDLDTSSLLILMSLGLMALGAVVCLGLWIAMVVAARRVPIIPGDDDNV